jgi:hypothetical protein
VVWLGAAMIIGSGSTSFEMLRYVGDRSTRSRSATSSATSARLRDLVPDPPGGLLGIDESFYLLTLALAAVWALGAFASGPLHLGSLRFRGHYWKSDAGYRCCPRRCGVRVGAPRHRRGAGIAADVRCLEQVVEGRDCLAIGQLLNHPLVQRDALLMGLDRQS